MIKNSASFTVYNASAGSGKTYALVKLYIKTLLEANTKDAYKGILAITFTNKAVTEMKSRILEVLHDISTSLKPSKYQNMLEDLIQETGMSHHDIKEKMDTILKRIIHNYSAFDVVTIDTFTHRIIRSFAYDLGIPINFDIEMDDYVFIEEAVEGVLSKVGSDKELTNMLSDFVISKIDEDKNWDITKELIAVSMILYNENHKGHLDNQINKEISAFEGLKRIVQQKLQSSKLNIIRLSEEVLKRFQTEGLDDKDFTRSYLPLHFKKLSKGDITVSFSASWKANIESSTFYNKTLQQDKKDLIDGIREFIIERFQNSKNEIQNVVFYQNILKNITPLSVINAINKALNEIKKQKGVLLISEFNKVISEAIQSQPTPFIYERLGEKYLHYFIDEFQDTSELQWKNLIPLIDNALASETENGEFGHLTIVGDAKQSIYRWRGGKASQFMELSGNTNPFSIAYKDVCKLPKNYRSAKEIVKFNNSFFTFISDDFIDPSMRDLYFEGNHQQFDDNDGGYVSLSFINSKNRVEEDQYYPERVYQIIEDLQSQNYRLKDICILVRRQKEGVVIANYLMGKGCSIISSETLLIKNAPEIQFIINFLTWFLTPKDKLAKVNLLYFISSFLKISDTHLFLTKMLPLNKKFFFKELKVLGVNIDLDYLNIISLYDKVIYLINKFKLEVSSPAHVQFFLDFVFDFTQKRKQGIQSFLFYWDQNKDKMSIVIPEDKDAVQIMTIHKSKGLEFPCVIYPYANTDIYKEVDPRVWFPVNENDFNDFEEVFINYNKSLRAYNQIGEKIVSIRESQLELDAINLLYVALTRSINQLYIVSNYEVDKNGQEKSNKFSGKFIRYLKSIKVWDSELREYEFGTLQKFNLSTVHKSTEVTNKIFCNNNESQGLYHKLWLSEIANIRVVSEYKAKERGSLIHDMLAEIKSLKDLISIIEAKVRLGKIAFEEKGRYYNLLEGIVTHKELSQFFSDQFLVYNEKEIVDGNHVYRPDKIVIDHNNEATIIEFKTGGIKETHKDQVLQYGCLLSKIGFDVRKMILVYIKGNTLDVRYL